jgi:gliding motility-associated protein GldL
MLMVGLLTEAAIFTISAFEPVHQELDWSLVYPELAGMDNDDKPKNQGTISQQLDKMLEEAKVGPELITSLGTGLRSLSDNVSSMADLSSATVATEEYTQNVKQASSSLSGINSSYTKAVEAMDGIVNAAENSKEYSVQIDRMTKNLSSLNSVYELEITESNNHLRTINEYVTNLTKVTSALADTQGQAETFKDEMGRLSSNLTSLNNVYGNMLAAMNVGSRGGNN